MAGSEKWTTQETFIVIPPRAAEEQLRAGKRLFLEKAGVISPRTTLAR
jgi:hypothetical protein